MMTGMHSAISLKKFNRALILLDITQGEGAEICDKSGSNLIHAAIQHKMPAVQFKKLLKLCIKATKAESHHMRIEAAKRLLNKTAGDKHETALQMALKSRMHQHAQELIDFYDAPEGYDDTDNDQNRDGHQQGPDYIVDPTRMNESALLIAIDHGCPPELIKKLLKRGCDPASTDDNNKLLVGVNKKTNLEHVKAILDWTYPAEYLNKLLETAVTAKRRDIIRLLLAQKVDVAQRIFTQVIVDSENEEYAMLLVRHTSSAESLVNHLSGATTCCPKDDQYGLEQEQNVVLFHELIKRMPDVAEEALHRSVTISGTTDDFHYYTNTKSLLSSKQNDSMGDVENGSATATLNCMVDHKELRLLEHPGVMYVLNSKWNEIGLPLYLAQLIAHLFLVVPLSVLVLLPTAFEDTKSYDYMLTAYILAAVVIVITLTLLLSLVILLVRQKYIKESKTTAQKSSFSRKLNKECCPLVKNANIILQCIVFIFSILYSVLVIARTAKDGECCERASWHVGLFAIFLNWTNLIRLLSKLPTIGEHVIVFFDILWTFVKLTILGILLVLAATIVLMITFYNSQAQLSPFFTFRRGIVTVLTMIAGELDYLSVFGLSYDIVNDTTVQSTVAYSETAYFAWVVFLILVPILLSNMLIGLAVGDVIEIKKNAALRKLKQKVKLVSVAEDFLYGGAQKHRRKTCFSSCFSSCVEAIDKAVKWICIGEELSPQEKLVREKFLSYERKREAERKNGLPEGESLQNTRVEERVDDVRIVALSCEQKIKEAYDGTIKKLMKETEKLREELQELKYSMNYTK